MSNSIAIPDEVLANARRVVAANAKSKAQILRFTKGTFHLGVEKTPVPPGTRFTLLMDQARFGWQKWVAGRPENVVGRVVDGYVPTGRDELGDDEREHWVENPITRMPEDPWKEVVFLTMVGPGNTPVMFTSSSTSGIVEFWALMNEWIKLAPEHPGEMPVMEIGVASFDTKKYGRIQRPDFKIVDWISAPAPTTAQAEAKTFNEEEIPF